MIGFGIASFFFAILFGLLFVLASCFSYFNKHKKRYNFGNMFPCEHMYKSTFYNNFYGNTGLILSILGYIGTYVALLNVSKNGFVIALSICGILASIFMTFIVFIPIGNIKVHVASTAMLFVFNLSSAVLLCLGSYTLFQEFEKVTLQTGFYISLVLTFVSLVVVTNPKLSLRIQAKEKIDEQGNKIYERPKFIPLAVSQWIIIFLNYIVLVGTLLILVSI